MYNNILRLLFLAGLILILSGIGAVLVLVLPSWLIRFFKRLRESKPSLLIAIPKIVVHNLHSRGYSKELLLSIDFTILNRSIENNSIKRRIIILEGAKDNILSSYYKAIPPKMPVKDTFSLCFVLGDQPPQKQYNLTLRLIDQHNKIYTKDIVVDIPDKYLL